jgi:hypothetical protein
MMAWMGFVLGICSRVEERREWPTHARTHRITSSPIKQQQQQQQAGSMRLVCWVGGWVGGREENPLLSGESACAEGDHGGVVHLARISDVVVGQLLKCVGLHEVPAGLRDPSAVLAQAWVASDQTSSLVEAAAFL